MPKRMSLVRIVRAASVPASAPALPNRAQLRWSPPAPSRGPAGLLTEVAPGDLYIADVSMQGGPHRTGTDLLLVIENFSHRRITDIVRPEADHDVAVRESLGTVPRMWRCPWARRGSDQQLS
jgi:hypothetical protein